jgi:6-pyruvoyl-tetrahydropterin synthase
MLLLIILSVLATYAFSHGSSGSEFVLGVRDSIMIAHSFKGEEFGPAQNLHGATYTVDVDFSQADLVPGCNWVIDIGQASEKLSEVLKEFNYRNLDDIFPQENTTTEFMCKEIHKRLSKWLLSISYKGGLRVKL